MYMQYIYLPHEFEEVYFVHSRLKNELLVRRVIFQDSPLEDQDVLEFCLTEIAEYEWADCSLIGNVDLVVHATADVHEQFHHFQAVLFIAIPLLLFV